MKAERHDVSQLLMLWHTTIIVEIYWAYYVCPQASFDHGFLYMQSHALKWKCLYYFLYIGRSIIHAAVFLSGFR